MTQQLLYQPYTYYISWTHLDVHYYGVRWSEEIRGLKPEEDLWINYFTSSKKVEEFREKHGEPDRIKICQRFDNAKDARLWEEKFLRRVNVINEDRWLNQSCSDGNFAFTYHTEKSKQKMSRSWDKRRVKHPVTDETRQKMSKGIKEYYSKPEKREAASKRTAELWQDKDFRERMLDSRKAYFQDSEN